MKFLSKFGVELILLCVFQIIRSVLSSKLIKKELKIQHYIVTNILFMIVTLIIIIYMKKSIDFILGTYMVFVICDIYELLVKGYLKRKNM